jgi:hypothetical protein
MHPITLCFGALIVCEGIRKGNNSPLPTRSCAIYALSRSIREKLQGLARKPLTYLFFDIGEHSFASVFFPALAGAATQTPSWRGLFTNAVED